MTDYTIIFVDIATGTRMAEMQIKAIDMDAAQTVADDMNSTFNVYVEETE